MDPHPHMHEGEFIKAIDEHFYFETDREYEEIARMGCSISDNASSWSATCFPLGRPTQVPSAIWPYSIFLNRKGQRPLSLLRYR